MRKSLTKSERVRKRREFSRLFASPFRFQTQGMKLFFLYQETSRLGMTLARGFGKAVDRNKTKRHVREIFRVWKAETEIRGDFLFMIFPGDYRFNDRQEQFNHLVGRIPRKNA